jgi:hypothetical protein
MKTIFTIMSFVIATNCFAQINTLYVEPNETDSAYKKTDTNYVCNKNSNYIVRNTKTNLNKLLLFLGGTKSNPKEYKIFSDFAGKLGYDVINLSYPNSVLAAGLGCSSDSLAFNKYRQAICYGTPGSSDVKVDTLNSIYTRTVKLINYLNKTYPKQKWEQYLKKDDPTTLDWSKITVGGHSQGGGHACYFAKFNKVERVLMFSSPNDYSYSFPKSANWLSTPGVTSMNKHFAYLSVFDAKIPFYNQMMNIQSLGLYPSYGAINVDTSSEPYGFSRCLYTAQLTRLPLKLTSKIYHLLTIILGSSINKSVWTYMLTSDVSIVSNECQK